MKLKGVLLVGGERAERVCVSINCKEPGVRRSRAGVKSTEDAPSRRVETFCSAGYVIAD